MRLNSRFKLIQESDSCNGIPTGAQLELRWDDIFKGAPINLFCASVSSCHKFGARAGAYI